MIPALVLAVLFEVLVVVYPVVLVVFFVEFFHEVLGNVVHVVLLHPFADLALLDFESVLFFGC